MKRMIYAIALLCVVLCAACNESLDIAVLERTPDFIGEMEMNFTPEQLKLPGKKGVCLTLKSENKELNIARVKSLRPYWNYSWGSGRIEEQPDEIEFVPMIWGKNGVQSSAEDLKTQIGMGMVHRILGFNEPDGKDQSNVSVEKAIELWPELMSLDIPLGSPAVVGTDKEKWLEEFMKQVEEKDYRVDYICVHNYGGGNAETFKQNMFDTYVKYQRPLLITEFAVADWNAKTTAENRHSPAKVLEFMKEVLPWLENTDYIYGYSWFAFPTDSPQGCSSALFDQTGKLTQLGKFYRDFKPNEAVEPIEPPIVEPNNPVEPPVESNLLLSPGFEDANARMNWGNIWTNVNYDDKTKNQAIAGDIISGNVTVRLAGKKAWAGVNQNVKVEKGKTYEFGFTGRAQEAPGPSGSPSTKRKVTLVVRKDKQNVYKTLEVTTGTNTTVSGMITIADDMPETLNILIYKDNGIAYVDDVFFKEK